MPTVLAQNYLVVSRPGWASEGVDSVLSGLAFNRSLPGVVGNISVSDISSVATPDAPPVPAPVRPSPVPDAPPTEPSEPFPDPGPRPERPCVPEPDPNRPIRTCDYTSQAA